MTCIEEGRSWSGLCAYNHACHKNMRIQRSIFRRLHVEINVILPIRKTRTFHASLFFSMHIWALIPYTFPTFLKKNYTFSTCVYLSFSKITSSLILYGNLFMYPLKYPLSSNFILENINYNTDL